MTQTQSISPMDEDEAAEAAVTDAEWTEDGHTVEISIRRGAVTVTLHCPHRGKAACRTGGKCELVTLSEECTNEELWAEAEADYAPKTNPFPIMHKVIEGYRYIAAVRN